MAEKYKPSVKCPVPGQYEIVPQGPERTVVKSEPFPPTLKRGQRYVLVDKTKTK